MLLSRRGSKPHLARPSLRTVASSSTPQADHDLPVTGAESEASATPELDKIRVPKISIHTGVGEQPTLPEQDPQPAHRSFRDQARAILVDLWTELRGKKTYYRYREREDRKRRILGVTLHLLTTVSAVVYLFWALTVLNWSVWYVSVPFLAAEVATLLTATLFAFIIWYPRYHKEQGITTEIRPSVDVFITTCGEPQEILTRTVAAATRIAYEPKTVYILDDAGSPEVETLAWQMGCEYLSREDRGDAKAGNLNFGLSSARGDLVLALDADQVPEPDILDRLVGYFKFPDIGFVQSAQRFLLPEGDPFGNSDELFYRVMQAGKDSHNAAFSCGSGVLYRRSALESVGGFSTWNLVEDVHTSMRLHEKGWRSVYHNHPLTTGTAPADILGVYKQREQWATDSLRLIFWDNPLRKSGLTLPQKLQYFYTGYGYLISALLLPFYFLIPAWSLLTGEFLLDTSAFTYAGFRGVYLLLTVLTLVVLEYPVDSRKPYKMWAGLFPVFSKATIRALRSRAKKPKYVVNGKTVKTPTWLHRFRAILPQVSLIAIIAGSITYAVLRDTLPPGLLLVNAVWGLWGIWSVSGICYAAMQSRRPPAV